MLWDLTEGKHLYSLDAQSVIHTLVFSPNRYWLCAGTEKNIVIWDLETKVRLLWLRLLFVLKCCSPWWLSSVSTRPTSTRTRRRP